MDNFDIGVKTVPQVFVTCKKCGHQAVAMMQQNYFDTTKPNNAIIICHDCKIAEVVSAVDYDAMIKKVSPQL